MSQKQWIFYKYIPKINRFFTNYDNLLQFSSYHILKTKVILKLWVLSCFVISIYSIVIDDNDDRVKYESMGEQNDVEDVSGDDNLLHIRVSEADDIVALRLRLQLA